MFHFWQNLLEKKAIGKEHALALPRQNVTPAKMSLSKLELGKKLKRQNVNLGKTELGKMLTRQNVKRQIVTMQNVAEPLKIF